ncbi:DUF1329 domain-containing protein [Nitrogeniibacter mangrovi]|uniref:DUF1329 domain-containing protein n=1 Tax=Nitrogeniibacter mangrovi TaxID=2016596 RepID=A0A6C1B3T2_9RHOO|nr:DUF1329 domain-containing protein [Nitrogeniibacter mangrovi]QID17649.1 DUF1329 domain-containing protein [Nitrogeniibacter mangrovi]
MHKRLRLLTLSCLIGLPVITCAQPLSEQVIDQAFYTYRNGTPSSPNVKPGMTITKDNVDSVKDALNPTMYEFIKKGEFEMHVGKTFDFTLHEKYIDATRKNAAQVTLKKGQMPEHYVAGRPFPQSPRLDDPLAGEKLAWNFQYGRVWGDLGCIDPFIWDFKNYDTGAVERTITFDRFCLKRYAFRTVDEPTPEFLPNPSKLYRGIYARVSEPEDIKGTQLLIQKYQDDTKLTDAYLYLGFQRRVRRLATGQTTDSFLGSDMMIEDFEGYNGRISDYQWTYKETRPMLLPFWDRNEVPNKGKQHQFAEPDGSVWKYTSFTGQGNCHADAPYQLRITHILEAKPKDPNHPIGKRLIYLDAQTNEVAIEEIFDRSGKIWKQFVIGWVHPDRGAHPDAAGTGADIGDTFAMIDLQSRHCTTGSFRGRVGPDLVPDQLFSVQNLRGSD